MISLASLAILPGWGLVCSPPLPKWEPHSSPWHCNGEGLPLASVWAGLFPCPPNPHQGAPPPSGKNGARAWETPGQKRPPPKREREGGSLGRAVPLVLFKRRTEQPPQASPSAAAQATTFAPLSSPFQDGVLQNRRLWLLIKALCRFRSSSRYRVLQRQLERDAMWPPVHGRDLADAGSSGQAYLNAAFEREEPAAHPGSRAGAASRGSAQPEGSSRGDSPAEPRKGERDTQETRCWHRCSEETFPRAAAP